MGDDFPCLFMNFWNMVDNPERVIPGAWEDGDNQALPKDSNISSTKFQTFYSHCEQEYPTASVARKITIQLISPRESLGATYPHYLLVTVSKRIAVLNAAANYLLSIQMNTVRNRNSISPWGLVQLEEVALSLYLN